MIALLGEWALALLVSASCPTPTSWVEVSTIEGVCGDEDGAPVQDIGGMSRESVPRFHTRL